MIGKVMTAVTGAIGQDEMRFTSEAGDVFSFYHSQDCCESVSIEDIAGDLSDLIGSPILQAEEVSSDEPENYEYSDYSHTWTFYKFATANGYVTVRWLGTSNGYYSEGVYYSEQLAGGERTVRYV